MKVTVQKKESYSLTINGKLINGFQVESEWNGFVKMKNEAGQTVIVDDFRNQVFSFGGIFHDDEPKEADLLKTNFNV